MQRSLRLSSRDFASSDTFNTGFSMACGKPAIGCFGQGIEEIIADSKNGCLIPPNDETVLTETLTRLLKDGDLRRKLGFAARNTVLQKHTLEHQARQFREVYAECLR